MVRRKLLLGCIAVAAISWTDLSDAGSDAIAVIVNKANPVGPMSQENLRPIYLMTKTVWSNGTAVEPFNLPDGTPMRTAFDSAVLGMNPDEVARYWIDRRIRGDARPPRKVPSPGTVLSLVAKDEGAIGYVPLAEVNASVKVVARVEGGQVKAP
jgi:ABC-type phosphate transport system substrate-binding protein